MTERSYRSPAHLLKVLVRVPITENEREDGLNKCHALARRPPLPPPLKIERIPVPEDIHWVEPDTHASAPPSETAVIASPVGTRCEISGAPSTECVHAPNKAPFNSYLTDDAWNTMCKHDFVSCCSPVGRHCTAHPPPPPPSHHGKITNLDCLHCRVRVGQMKKRATVEIPKGGKRSRTVGRRYCWTAR